MIVTRRQILIGACAATTAVLTARLSPCGNATSIGNMGLVPHGMDALLLHDGSASAAAIARDLKTSRSMSRVTDTAVMLLTLHGFSRAGTLLDGARGRAFLSLLDDADTVVMESLLKVRGANNLVRGRHGPRALLTARL